MDSALWGEWKVRTQNEKSMEAVEQTQNSEGDYRIPSEVLVPGRLPGNLQNPLGRISLASLTSPLLKYWLSTVDLDYFKLLLALPVTILS